MLATRLWVLAPLLASTIPTFARAQSGPDVDYIGLSFTGDGTTPPALEMLQAQQRGPKDVDASASAGDKGDASFSFPIPLPPAHIVPELALTYSSASDSHSVLGRGWSLAAEAGHRSFENPETGDALRFDKGKPGRPGHAGNDHYHRPNPNATGKQDAYLDADGNPVPDGSDPSHLYP